jgi:predicted dehydrogenase
MSVRLGILSAAHLHAYGYARGISEAPSASLAGIWDPDGARCSDFAKRVGTKSFQSREELFASCDAVIVCSENARHAQDVESAAAAGKHVLCEKPLVTNPADRDRMFAAVEAHGVKLMTAFPCRYSPGFQRLSQRLEAGEIGAITGICATNRGRCPGGWFVDTSLSGGGAMIDHTVHVADLLRLLLGKGPDRVQAFTGSNMYGESWEDTAMLALDYGDVFCTLDSSWSRPQSYKTWGDVTMNVVGERGVLELNMFGQALDTYRNGASRPHEQAGYGSDLDKALVEDFLRCILEDAPPAISKEDGWAAVEVALAGYESARTGLPAKPGQPIDRD